MITVIGIHHLKLRRSLLMTQAMINGTKIEYIGRGPLLRTASEKKKIEAKIHGSVVLSFSCFFAFAPPGAKAHISVHTPPKANVVVKISQVMRLASFCITRNVTTLSAAMRARDLSNHLLAVR